MTDFLEYLRVNPKSLEQTVFRYLKYGKTVPTSWGVAQSFDRPYIEDRQLPFFRSVSKDMGSTRRNFQSCGPPQLDSGGAKTIRTMPRQLARTAVSGDWFVAKGALNSILYLYYFGEIPEFGSEWKFVFLRRQTRVRQAIPWRSRQQPSNGLLKCRLSARLGHKTIPA